ncbi:hypothetical protein P280DRAFT_241631 [Massarina eburnea CBS 473.64]|uniref:SET domain-containing protein n=1 Tax=Massarina eburnea CBS 473.64 TaxID=1395130 RepID=A0A6A6S531_9PLEO|nr:hypothetical protein P280DRAFT_241631 [Massarina eburnea CBS 473.64]
MADRDTSPASTASIHSKISAHMAQVPVSRGSSSASPPTSTPPTSLGDDTSILSDATKMEQAMELQKEASPSEVAAAESPAPESADSTPNSVRGRPVRSSRKAVPTYNVQILAGTAVHTPSKYLETHHANVLHGPLDNLTKSPVATPPQKRSPRLRQSPADGLDPAEQQLATESQAALRRTSSRATDLRRQAALNSSGVVETVVNTFKDLVPGALKRSASDSRLRSSTQSAIPASPKRPRTAHQSANEGESDEEEEKEFVKPKTKEWMTQGLFVGQHREFNARLSESQNRARRKSRAVKESTVLPLPMFSYADALATDVKNSNRNFKLPYDVYNPLPRKVKVDGWVKLSRNRFIGDASALWKRDKQDASQCYCLPEEGCGEACHNRIMAYECDETNCRLTEEECGNRPFAQLKKRSRGNGYDYGVEVMETEGKGYGVRAMRTFDKHQIIVEYAGEIITQNECERRMKQIYKKDKCYYLMSFDNKMIIDATRGTIARFVNHSCEPNCEMIKWTVRGEPRMALFAGKRGIMSGEELTYDYNFDPFSTKNIQECHCGTESCRGVLGPKLKKPSNEEKSLASSIFAGTKRKLQEVFSSRGSESASSSPKKRRIGNAAQTKLMNAQAEVDAARERARQEQALQAAQLASREDRALKRNQSLTMTRRSTVLRNAARAAIPSSIKSRHTTFNIRKVSKPGALKPVKRRTATVIPKPTGKKGLRPNRTAATKTSERSATPDASSEDEDDESPNITPASLRSASKKLVQSKLNFKAAPLRFPAKTTSRTEIPDTEDEDEELPSNAVTTGLKGKKRGSVAAPTRSLHTTGAGVFKLGSRGRNRKGLFVKKGRKN